MHYYPYYDPKTKGLLFDKLRDMLQQLPPESIILFHPFCHNPTEVDLTKAQWDTVILILKKHHLIPFHAKRVEYVLLDPVLFKAWAQELDTMCRRLVSLRKQLADVLGTLEPSRDFSCLIRHRVVFFPLMETRDHGVHFHHHRKYSNA